MKPKPKSQPTAKPKPKRSPCPIACTLDIIGDKWTLLVVRDMLLGRSQFKQFVAAPEGIASNILADRLARLVEHGLAEKRPLADRQDRDSYRLTKKGESLGRLLKEMVDWGLRNIEGTEAKMRPK